MILATKVIINKPIPCGHIAENLTPGSEHSVIEPPEEYKEKYPNGEGSYWVMGIGEPVRLLVNEYTVSERQNVKIQT